MSTAFVLSGGADVRVLPALCPLTVSSMDFSHAAELIRRGREASAEWLAAGAHTLPHQERFLTLHDHGQPGQRSGPLPDAADARAS